MATHESGGALSLSSSDEEVKAGDVDGGPPPQEGTPADDALKANAGIHVSRFDKTVGRHIRRPKPKNLVRNVKRNKGQRRRSYIKGKIIDGKHEQYTLALGMMHALRVAIGRRAGPTSRQMLRVVDFMAVDKYTFPPEGISRGPLPTPPHHLTHTFKFKDYSPMVFRDIRALSNLADSSYMLSVCGNNNFIEFIPNSKSGQFFFYSHDGKYMIKTQTPEENRFLRRILPYYYRHLRDNPDSLMTRFYGMHRVKMYHLRRKVHFVIMGSVFNTTERIHTIYDLKGSRVGRSATEHERQAGGVLKDNDLVNDGRKLVLGPKKARFLDILRRDVAFLKEMSIMDYSILLGIHDKRKAAQERQEAANEQACSGELSPRARMRSDTPLTRLLKSKHKDGSAMLGDDRETFVLQGSNPQFQEEQGEVDSDHESLMTVEEDAQRSPRSTPSATSMSSGTRSDRPGFLSFLARRKTKPGTPRASRASPVPAQSNSDDQGPPPLPSHKKYASEDSIDSPAYQGALQVYSDEEYSESEVEDVETDEEGRMMGTHRMLARGASPRGARAASGRTTPSRQREHAPSSTVAGAANGAAADAAGESKIEGNGTAGGVGRVQRDGSKESLATLGATPSLAAIYPEGPQVLTRRKDMGVRSRTETGELGDEIYFMGIIDILQQYNLKKRSETLLRAAIADVKLISAVDPDLYGSRFLEFMAENSA